jgi:radical SAM protein with 4Fe4S-binding SPASM domain
MNSKQKYQLFRQRKHFCTAPWNLLYVGVDGTIKTCTHGKAMGNPQEHDITEILSNKKFQYLRKEILEDKITDNCRSCLMNENTSSAGEFKGLRNHYNGLGVHSSVDYTDVSQFELWHWIYTGVVPVI